MNKKCSILFALLILLYGCGGKENSPLQEGGE
jgi:hypothetical protein